MNGSTVNIPTTLWTTRAAPKPNYCQTPEDPEAWTIILMVILAFLLFASICGNSLVILATMMSKPLRQRVTVYFIVSLAIADLMNASAKIPIEISFEIHSKRFCHSQGVCYWYQIAENISTIASMLCLFFIAIDRFIAIKYPFKHQSMFTTRKVRFMVLGIWIFSFCFALSNIFQWKHTIYSKSTMAIDWKKDRSCTHQNRLFFSVGFGLYAVLLVIMTITYSMILSIALTQIRAIEGTTVAAPRLDSIDPAEADKERAQRMRRKELKATKSVALVYVFYLICWFPLFVIVNILQYNQTHFRKLRESNMTVFLFIWHTFVQILPAVNTMINPIIYSFSNNQFKNAFKSIYRRMVNKFDSGHLDYSQSRSNRTQSGISLASTAYSQSSVAMQRKSDVNGNGLPNNGYEPKRRSQNDRSEKREC
eukprot:TCONS_00033102-protein